MRIPAIAMLLILVSPILADCPRVSGEEDDRRANAGCLILQDGQALLVSHRWGGKLGVPGGTREENELAQCTAYRETLEETGLAVTVGRRLEVMKNGFHLYRCYPQQPLSASPLAVPARALAEVKGLGWHTPGSLDRENWRFSYQFDLFLDVLNRALQQENAEPE